MSRVRVSSSAPRKARTAPAVRALILSHAGPTAPSSAYRATGADLFVASTLPAHGVAMEGYFWRFTDAATGAS